MSKIRIIERDIGREVKEPYGQYPVVPITGPRQSGKTTLAGRTAMLKLPLFSFNEVKAISGEMQTNDLIHSPL